MTSRNWLITGVSSGFGRELAIQLLERGVNPAGVAALDAAAIAVDIGQMPASPAVVDEFAHFLSLSSERTDSVSSSQESVNFWMPSFSRTVKTSSRSTPASATAFMTCAASS
jgi:NAD(P)-dependent dehydrogenase (short-subunit alcohol dehydrogenase family)